MMPAMTFEEAFDRAREELADRAKQMTNIEFQELLHDRAQELLGRPKPARLTGGRRLGPEEWLALSISVNQLLSDFEHVAVLGDARLHNRSTLVVLFRLTRRPDIGYSIELQMQAGKMGLGEAGRHVAVKLYDTLTADRVQYLIDAKPLS